MTPIDRNPSLRRWGRRTVVPAFAALVQALALAPTAQADPVLTTYFSQATYDVDVRPGSDLSAWFGYSGVGITSYSTAQALTPPGVILEAFPGQFLTRTQQLKLHFQSKPGYVFDSVSMSHLLSYFNDRGGARALMSWTLDPEDGPAQTGSTALWEDMNWFHGGSFADPTQAAPTLALGGDDAFDLDVTLFYVSAGAPGGCGTVSGVCQQISATYVKVWVDTVPGTDDDPPPRTAPEPSPLALLLGIGLVRAARRRAQSQPTSSANGSSQATDAQRA